MPDKAIIDELGSLLPPSACLGKNGSLLLMAGLPGSGKSSIVVAMSQFLPFCVVSTDWVRAQLRERPIYTAAEQEQVYAISYGLITQRLACGQRVVFDASNYKAARREYVTELAKRSGAPVAIALVQAAQQVIHQRLLQRMSRERTDGDLSDADWSVYKWMVETQEPIVEPHLVLDTTDTPIETLAQRLYRYWMQVEAHAAGNSDLQPTGRTGRLRLNDFRDN